MAKPNDYASRLRDNGLKATPARVHLLEAFEAAKRPMSLQSDVLADVDTFGDRTTVYRNLVAFEEKGLISRIPTSGRRDYYELAQLAPHAHIYCDSCGVVECLDEAPSMPKAKQIDGWSEVATEVTFHGHCSTCNTQE